MVKCFPREFFTLLFYYFLNILNEIPLKKGLNVTHTLVIKPAGVVVKYTAAFLADLGPFSWNITNPSWYLRDMYCTCLLNIN